MTAADIPDALRWDVSHAKRTLRGQPLPILQDALRMESQRTRRRKRILKWLQDQILPPMTLPASQHPASSIQHPAPTPQHGGPRKPGPGKKLGRPTKQPKAKAICTTITLSSPKTLKTLQGRAKRAKLRPGAYIERELELNLSKRDKLEKRRHALLQQIEAAHASFDAVKTHKIVLKLNLLERQIAQMPCC